MSRAEETFLVSFLCFGKTHTAPLCQAVPLPAECWLELDHGMFHSDSVVSGL